MRHLECHTYAVLSGCEEQSGEGIAMTTMSVDSINRAYSMRAHEVDPSTGRSLLETWDRAEWEKVAQQRGITLEQLAAEQAEEDRRRLQEARDRRVAEMAERIQSSTIGGLAVAGHGRQARYLPWHLPWTEKNGITVVHDTMTTSQALVTANLDGWQTELRPAFVRSGGRLVKADEYGFARPRLIVRRANPTIVARLRRRAAELDLSEALTSQLVGPFDRDWVLGQTRNDAWKPLRAEQMARIGDALRKGGEAADVGELPVETAGWLRGGAWTFMTFRVGDTRYVLGEDPTDYYLSFHNYFTGHHANVVSIERVREMCDNTFKLGEARADALIRFDHRGDVEGKLDAGVATVMEAMGFIDADLHAAERLASIDVAIADFEALMVEVIGDTEANAKAKRAKAVEVYATSPTLANLGFNGWRAEQATIEATQWLGSIRSPNARLMSVWDNRGATQLRTRKVRSLLLGAAR
jgi:hypothetical protein